MFQKNIWYRELYIKTAKGLAKYDDLEKEIFVQHGYHIKHCEEPFPILEQLKKQTCAEVCFIFICCMIIIIEFLARKNIAVNYGCNKE